MLKPKNQATRRARPKDAQALEDRLPFGTRLHVLVGGVFPAMSACGTQQQRRIEERALSRQMVGQHKRSKDVMGALRHSIAAGIVDGDEGHHGEGAPRDGARGLLVQMQDMRRSGQDSERRVGEGWVNVGIGLTVLAQQVKPESEALPSPCERQVGEGRRPSHGQPHRTLADCVLHRNVSVLQKVRRDVEELRDRVSAAVCG